MRTVNSWIVMSCMSDFDRSEPIDPIAARRRGRCPRQSQIVAIAGSSRVDSRGALVTEQLCDALGACTQSNAVYRHLLKMALEELQLIDEQIGQLDQEMASLLQPAPECSREAGGGARAGSGLSAADYCRSRTHRSDSFPPRNVSPRGLVLARATRRARA